MTTAAELFRTRIDKLLASAGPRREEAEQALAALLLTAPTGDKAAIGKLVGPKLKQLELLYSQAAPPPPRLSQEEKLQALVDSRVLDTKLLARLLKQKGQPGFGQCVEGAYGQLQRTRDGCDDATLLVGAYTQVCGYLFERSRRDRAQSMSNFQPRLPTTKTHVSYRGLGTRDKHTGQRPVLQFDNVPIDNDVPVLRGRIWETKWYVRREYGADRHAINQILKYQAAIDAGVYETATVEVYGHIHPPFLEALAEGREIAPGLALFAPDVELIYALDEERSVVLKPSRHASTLASTDEGAQAVRHAVLDRKYDTFSKRVLRDTDLAPNTVSRLLGLWATTHAAFVIDPLFDAIREGFIDPERVTDVDAFRLYEALVQAKRWRLWSLT